MKKLITLSFLCLVFTNMSIAQIIGLKFGDSYATCKKILDDEYNNGVVSNQSLEKGDTVLTYENIKFEGKLYDKLQCVFFPQDNNLLLASISFSNTYSFDQKSIMRTTFNKWYKEYNEKYSFITELSQNESDIYMYEDSIHNSYIMITLATNDSLKEYTCGITYASMELMNDMLVSSMNSLSEEYQTAISCTMEIADVQFGWSYEKCKGILDKQFNDGKSSEQSGESLMYRDVTINDRYYGYASFIFSQEGDELYLDAINLYNVVPLEEEKLAREVLKLRSDSHKKKYTLGIHYSPQEGNEVYGFVDKQTKCSIMEVLMQQTFDDAQVVWVNTTVYKPATEDFISSVEENDVIEDKKPAVQDLRVAGVELGWSYEKCKPILDNKFNGGDDSYQFDKGRTLKYRDVHLGGQYYETVEFDFVNNGYDTFLNYVIFSSSWERYDRANAENKLKSVVDLYSQKYNLLKHNVSEDGFDEYFYGDIEAEFFITVKLLMGETNGGDTRIFLWVVYGTTKSFVNPLDEI